MRLKPPGYGRCGDIAAVTRGDAAGCLFEGVAAIVMREPIDNFRHRIGLVAQRARAGGGAVVARAAPIKAESFQLPAPFLRARWQRPLVG